MRSGDRVFKIRIPAVPADSAEELSNEWQVGLLLGSNKSSEKVPGQPARYLFGRKIVKLKSWRAPTADYNQIWVSVMRYLYPAYLPVVRK
jgi:hypothetical protein